MVPFEQTTLLRCESEQISPTTNNPSSIAKGKCKLCVRNVGRWSYGTRCTTWDISANRRKRNRKEDEHVSKWPPKTRALRSHNRPKQSKRRVRFLGLFTCFALGQAPAITKREHHVQSSKKLKSRKNSAKSLLTFVFFHQLRRTEGLRVVLHDGFDCFRLLNVHFWYF